MFVFRNVIKQMFGFLIESFLLRLQQKSEFLNLNKIYRAIKIDTVLTIKPIFLILLDMKILEDRGMRLIIWQHRHKFSTTLYLCFFVPLLVFWDNFDRCKQYKLGIYHNFFKVCRFWKVTPLITSVC